MEKGGGLVRLGQKGRPDPSNVENFRLFSGTESCESEKLIGGSRPFYALSYVDLRGETKKNVWQEYEIVCCVSRTEGTFGCPPSFEKGEFFHWYFEGRFKNC